LSARVGSYRHRTDRVVRDNVLDPTDLVRPCPRARLRRAVRRRNLAGNPDRYAAAVRPPWSGSVRIGHQALRAELVDLTRGRWERVMV
jgi:hypothetical protein